MSETEIEPKAEFIRKPNLSESRMFRGSEVWIEPRHYNREVTTFGGSRDLVIYNNANTNQNSYSDLGYAYQPPAGYQYGTPQTMSLFAGSYNFTPTEIEVSYSIITTFHEKHES